MLSFQKTVFALCNPIRPRGCEPLYNSKYLSFNNSNGAAFSLPCVTDGTCPYVKFRCSKGHEWKASPGSPVCFYCPICKGPRKIYGKKDKTVGNSVRMQELLSKIQLYAISNKGELLSSNISSSQTKAIFKCHNNHIFESRPSSLIHRQSWCPQCSKKTKILSKTALEATADQYGGKYLGIVEESTTKAPSSQLHKWECKLGHEFIQRPNNIRRRPNGKRKASWCPTCRKMNIEVPQIL